MAGPEDKAENEFQILHRRLESLSSALNAEAGKAGKKKAAEASADLNASSFGSAMNLGFRVLTEFAAAVVVGALIGWQIDVWAHTLPLFLIVFLAIGTAAGFWNVYRIAVKPTQR
jgi:ATP synthase protein I